MRTDWRDHWERRTELNEWDEVDALRTVLDANDSRGIKNRYIDAYLKHYLFEHIHAQKEDILLDVGCGIGRVSESISQCVRAVYGVDVVDAFVDYCNARPGKNSNTRYFKQWEIDALTTLMINKMYIIWVLTFILDESEVIDLLSWYRHRLPQCGSAVIIEQVKGHTMCRHGETKVSCCYRTIDEYRGIFAAAGYGVRRCTIMGERFHGLLYRVAHMAGNYLPKKLRGFSAAMFRFDHRLMGEHAQRSDLINDKNPTDVVFELEIGG